MRYQLEVGIQLRVLNCVDQMGFIHGLRVSGLGFRGALDRLDILEFKCAHRVAAGNTGIFYLERFFF